MTLSRLSFECIKEKFSSANPFDTQSATYQIRFLPARERQADILAQKSVKADYFVF